MEETNETKIEKTKDSEQKYISKPKKKISLPGVINCALKLVIIGAIIYLCVLITKSFDNTNIDYKDINKISIENVKNGENISIENNEDFFKDYTTIYNDSDLSFSGFNFSGKDNLYKITLEINADVKTYYLSGPTIVKNGIITFNNENIDFYNFIEQTIKSEKVEKIITGTIKENKHDYIIIEANNENKDIIFIDKSSIGEDIVIDISSKKSGDDITIKYYGIFNKLNYTEISNISSIN